MIWATSKAPAKKPAPQPPRSSWRPRSPDQCQWPLGTPPGPPKGDSQN